MPVHLLVLLVYRITEHGPCVGHASGLAIGILAEEQAKLLVIKPLVAAKGNGVRLFPNNHLKSAAVLLAEETGEPRYLPLRAEKVYVHSLAHPYKFLQDFLSEAVHQVLPVKLIIDLHCLMPHTAPPRALLDKVRRVCNDEINRIVRQTLEDLHAVLII